jgi:hypothetical protein
MATVTFTVPPSDKAINRSDNAPQHIFTQHVSAINLHSAIYNKYIPIFRWLLKIFREYEKCTAETSRANNKSSHLLIFVADGSIILAPESAVVTQVNNRTNSFQEVHTAYTAAPHNHSQHNQASSPEVLTSLVLILLMMGIMMPETCWDWFNSRNIHLIIVGSVGSIIHLIKWCTVIHT